MGGDGDGSSKKVKPKGVSDEGSGKRAFCSYCTDTTLVTIKYFPTTTRSMVSPALPGGQGCRYWIAHHANLSDCVLQEAKTVRKVIMLDILRGYYVLGDDNMFPLLGAAPRSAGGLGYSSQEIGVVFGAAGIVVIAAQLLLYPRKYSQSPVHHYPSTRDGSERVLAANSIEYLH